VTLIEATVIKSACHVGKADPFVILYVRHTKDKTKRSRTRHTTLHPVWNDVFRIEVCTCSRFCIKIEGIEYIEVDAIFMIPWFNYKDMFFIFPPHQFLRFDLSICSKYWYTCAELPQCVLSFS
jgi:hypothetical protein